jgi:hypothetical protein
MLSRSLLLALLGLASFGCFRNHNVPVRTANLPPPPGPAVIHSTRIWVELAPGVGAAQCVTPPGNRSLCFEDVDRALADALGRALWTSFPGVSLLGLGDAPAPGDYVLRLDLRLKAVTPAEGGPGWAAAARGRWQLERDGVALASQNVESVSRADFGYGRPLGYAAGEVFDAIAVHIGRALGSVPETHPQQPRPLPPVIAEPATSGSAAKVAAQTP